MLHRLRNNLPLFLALFGTGLFSASIGYYWGRKVVAEEFLHHCNSDALADRVAASLYAYYDQSTQAEEDDAARKDDIPHDTEAADAESDESESDDEEEGGEGLATAPVVPEKTTNLLYEAQLAGFGSLHSAEQYVSKLKAKNIFAHVARRATRTARGCSTTWYQVVTNPLPFSETSDLVARLKEVDHLKGVVLAEVKNNP